MISHAQATLNASGPVVVATIPQNTAFSILNGVPVLGQNLGAVNVYVGGSGVGTTNGIIVAPNAIISLSLLPGDVLYGFAGTGAADFRVLLSGIV